MDKLFFKPAKITDMTTKLQLLAFTLLIAAHNPLRGGMIYDITATDIDNELRKLEEFAGKLLLIVNVASKCGFTGQYENLESLYQKYKDDGLVVLGFPCNQFGGQEPGTSEDIKSFCSLTYGVTFPMFEKIAVNGPNQHPLYSLLAGENSPVKGRIKWNFSKFLVGRDGKILERFGSMTNPESSKITKAIEAAL